jgi:hypothetical protein
MSRIPNTGPKRSLFFIFLKGNVQVYLYLVVCVQFYVAVLALQDIPASLVARELGPLHQEIQALLLDKIFHLLD